MALLCAAIVVLIMLIPASRSTLVAEHAYPLRATGFELGYGDGYRVLTVRRPYPNAAAPRQYLFVERGRPIPERYRDLPSIRIPVERVITAASPLLAHFELLDAPDRVVGHDRTDRIYSQTFRKRSAEGVLREVGEPPQMDVERLIALEPDVVLINSLGPHSETEHKLRDVGLPVVIVGDWLENDPVGRAEWLLVAACLLQREHKAQRYLSELRSRYDALRSKAAEHMRRDQAPTVLVNAPYQGAWSVPRGGSYMARLLSDAGTRYPWMEHEGRGAIHLELESVIARAADADIWLNPGDGTSLADILRIDPRLHVFEPLRSGRVYSFTARTRPGGANDYFERGALEPDRILADLISIAHPHALPGHQLRYFRRLR